MTWHRDQVNVVRHQAIGPDFNADFLLSCREQINVGPEVGMLEKSLLPPTSPLRDVVWIAGNYETRHPWHVLTCRFVAEWNGKACQKAIIQAARDFRESTELWLLSLEFAQSYGYCHPNSAADQRGHSSSASVLPDRDIAQGDDRIVATGFGDYAGAVTCAQGVAPGDRLVHRKAET